MFDDSSANIKVSIRIRPEGSSGNGDACIEPGNDFVGLNTLILFSHRPIISAGSNGISFTSTRPGYLKEFNKKLNFDHVYWGDDFASQYGILSSTQEDVFRDLGQVRVLYSLSYEMLMSLLAYS